MAKLHDHKMLELFTARALRLRGAVELHRLRALAEIILAQIGGPRSQY